MFPTVRHPFKFALVATLALLAVPSASADELSAYDDKAAVIFSYFSIGNDDNPLTSLRTEQFAAQIEEIKDKKYSVQPLPEVIAAFSGQSKLPSHTIALTFDGADKSILNILPRLKENEIPFTVFIPAGRIGKLPFMDWDDLRTIKKTGLATFGLQPSSYSRLTGKNETDIKREINNSLAEIRKELDVEPTLFSYPFGEYNTAYKKTVQDMGFKAAIAQQSGVAHAGSDHYALPRFTQTELYGDMDRFVMTANALPFPAHDISPADSSITTLTPAIGFTAPESSSKYLKSLSCFSSGDEKPELEILGSRVEIRMEKPLNEERLRINCTLPVTGITGDEVRYRWLGMMFTVPQDKVTTSHQRPAEATGDYINSE